MDHFDEDLAIELKKLVERQKIVDCIHRYTRGVDRLDDELVRSAFTNDGRTGIRGVDEFIDHVHDSLQRREASLHYVTNYVIEIEDDLAHAESYFIAVRQLIGTDTLIISGGRYVDRLERTNGEWRISLRRHISEWKANTDGSDMQDYLKEGGNLRRLDRTDLSYMRPLTI